MIREALNSDLLGLSSLARIVAKNIRSFGIDQWSDTYPVFSDFEKDLLVHGLFVFVLDDLLVGSITVLKENDPFYKELIWNKDYSMVIHRLMIAPTQMRKGIGSSLTNYAIHLAKDLGYASIKIDTHPDNLRMQGLILSCGFKEIGYMKAMNRIGYELVF